MTVQVLRSGILAGLIAGVLIDAFLVAAAVIGSHAELGTTIVSLFQFTASGEVGKATAFSSPTFAWLGALVHFAVSIAWATGFAYLAQSRQQLIAHPLISGFGYGFVVWILMQIVLIGAGLFQNPTPPALARSTISSTRCSSANGG